MFRPQFHTTALITGLAALLCTSACGTLDFDGWLDQPVPIAIEDGIPFATVRVGGPDNFRLAIDSGSALTALSSQRVFGTPSPGLREVELSVLDDSAPSVTRFVFHNLETYDMADLTLGVGAGVEAHGIIGTTILSAFSIELAYGLTPHIVFSDGIPDDRIQLANECKREFLVDPLVGDDCTAEFLTPLLGGGTIRLAGEDREIAPSRMVVPLCLMPNAFDPKAAEALETPTSGQPATALVSTGLGTSIISRSAFERLKDKLTTKTVAESTLHLPTGPEQIQLATIDRLALVSDETPNLGPCAEMARRRRMLVATPETLADADQEQNGAAIASLNKPMTFAVVADESPFLQGIIAELRPQTADIDIVLGGSALQQFQVHLDYPNERLVLRCDCVSEPGERCDQLPNQSCVVFPYCRQESNSEAYCLKEPEVSEF